MTNLLDVAAVDSLSTVSGCVSAQLSDALMVELTRRGLGSAGPLAAALGVDVDEGRPLFDTSRVEVEEALSLVDLLDLPVSVDVTCSPWFTMAGLSPATSTP